MADAREEGAVNTYAKLKDEYHTIQGVKSIKRNEVFYVSPDCKWIVTSKSSEYSTICTTKYMYDS